MPIAVLTRRSLRAALTGTAFVLLVACAGGPTPPKGDDALVARAQTMQKEACACLAERRTDCLQHEVDGVKGLDLFTRTQLTDLTRPQKEVFWAAKDEWNQCFVDSDMRRIGTK